MTSSTDLKDVFESMRPLVEKSLDIAEQFAAMRDACRTKEIDWAQVKALLKASILDGKDGGSRVEKLLDKATDATAYADMLGLVAPEKNISRDETPPAARTRRSKDRLSEAMSDAAEQSNEMAALGMISPEAAAETARIAEAVKAKFCKPTAPPEYDLADIPKGLDRRVSP